MTPLCALCVFAVKFNRAIRENQRLSASKWSGLARYENTCSILPTTRAASRIQKFSKQNTETFYWGATERTTRKPRRLSLKSGVFL